MRYFISNTVGSNPYNRASVRPGDHFLEVEKPLGSGRSIFLYIGRVSNRSAIIIYACLDTDFDIIIDAMSDSKLEDISAIWPKLATLLRNAYNSNYTECSLARQTDPDDGRMKWFVVLEVRNIVINGLDDITTSRMKGKMSEVVNKTYDMGIELRRKKPGMKESMKLGLKKGVEKAIDDIAKSIVKEQVRGMFS